MHACIGSSARHCHTVSSHARSSSSQEGEGAKFLWNGRVTGASPLRHTQIGIF